VPGALRSHIAKSSIAPATVTIAWPERDSTMSSIPPAAAETNSTLCIGCGVPGNRTSPDISASQSSTQGASELDMADGSGKSPNGRWM
jgi:hypothetical protein